MEPISSLSKINVTNDASSASPPKNIDRQNWSTDDVKAKQNDIKKSVSARVSVNYKLEQDEMEGVELHEWDD